MSPNRHLVVGAQLQPCWATDDVKPPGVLVPVGIYWASQHIRNGLLIFLIAVKANSEGFIQKARSRMVEHSIDCIQAL